MHDFPEYLRGIAKAFPSQMALAQALGMTPQRLSRALSGEGGYSFNVENCLRLAKAANRPALEVLRAAGKSDVADLLEHLFPRAGKPAISGDERDLIDEWRMLSADERSAFRMLIRGRVGERKRKPA